MFVLAYTCVACQLLDALCMCLYVSVCMCVRVYVCVCEAWERENVCVCMHVYVHMFACTCVGGCASSCVHVKITCF